MNLFNSFVFNKSNEVGNHHDAGFTILEVLIVIIIMIVVSAISINSYLNIREKQALQKDADSFVATLIRAKSLASNRKNDSSYGVKFSSTGLILYSGLTYATGNSISTYNFEKSVGISSTSLSSNRTEINFDKITGNPKITGTITLSTKSYSKIVTIYGTGIIEAK